MSKIHYIRANKPMAISHANDYKFKLIDLPKRAVADLIKTDTIATQHLDFGEVKHVLGDKYFEIFQSAVE